MNGGSSGGAQFGFTQDQWAATAPKVTPRMAATMQAWRFCAGWNPERVPIAAALYGLDDLETLYGDLLVIDNAIKAHAEAQRKAGAMRKGG